MEEKRFHSHHEIKDSDRKETLGIMNKGDSKSDYYLFSIQLQGKNISSQELKDIMKIMENKDNSQTQEDKKIIKCKEYYHSLSKKIDSFLNNIYIVILILFFTVFSLFNIDIKIMCLNSNVDPAFNVLNEICFVVLFTEFLLLVIFKENYIFSVIFLLDVFAILSMVPDTEFLMKPIRTLTNDESENTIDSTINLVKFSSASQAGAK